VLSYQEKAAIQGGLFFAGSTIPVNRIARRLAEAMKAKIRAQTRFYGAPSDAQQSTE